MTSARTLGLLLCLALPAFAADEKQIRLAAPGLSTVNVDEKLGTFLAEHFGQRLQLEGIRVISASEVQALVGVERQRQLLGCSEGSSSCLTELADAMGADGVISGSVGKFGSIYQVNIKILSATDAKALAIVSRKAFSDEDLIEMLNEAASDVAVELKQRLGRPGGGGDSVVEDRGSARSPSSEDREPPAESAATPASNTRQNAVSLNALGLGVGFLGLEYERVLGTHLSVFVTPSVYVPFVIETSFPGVEVLAGARFYVSGTAPTGFAVGLHLLTGYGVNAPTAFIGYRGELLFQAGLGDMFMFGLGASGGQTVLFGAGTIFDIGLRASVGLRF